MHACNIATNIWMWITWGEQTIELNPVPWSWHASQRVAQAAWWLHLQRHTNSSPVLLPSLGVNNLASNLMKIIRSRSMVHENKSISFNQYFKVLWIHRSAKYLQKPSWIQPNQIDQNHGGPSWSSTRLPIHRFCNMYKRNRTSSWIFQKFWIVMRDREESVRVWDQSGRGWEVGLSVVSQH